MKTNLDEFYKTDKNAELDGVWFDFRGGASFRLKRFGGFNSQNIKSVVLKLSKPYMRQIEAGTLPPEKDKEITASAFVECALVDWKGIISDGKEIEYSKENAVKLLIELPALFEELTRLASDIENYKENMGNA